MPQSLAKILLHVVFSTKDRRPYLGEQSIRDEFHHYLGGILNNLNCQALIVGGVEDHVHILCTLSRTSAPADLIKELKRASSIWIKTRDTNLQDFAWQNGYGIFSIGYSQQETVRKYIANQAAHHQRVTFQDEFRRLLDRYKIEYDEKYVWE